ncbi:hypothetical protein PHET_11257 [Paragonimus heterotremus]|uniref:Uncharacterized protein n=1 Tax=Paragonimus heterotremus TaxID=100268 RepID=A0A8J4ST51_9TREM|nr:hypothetical protein PHET_11257 [Paragonimus heterotremus]
MRISHLRNNPACSYGFIMPSASEILECVPLRVDNVILYNLYQNGYDYSSSLNLFIDFENADVHTFDVLNCTFCKIDFPVI